MDYHWGVDFIENYNRIAIKDVGAYSSLIHEAVCMDYAVV